MKKVLSICLTAAIVVSALNAEAITRHKALFQPREHSASRQFRQAPGAVAGVKPFSLTGEAGRKAPKKRVTEGGMNIYGYLFYSDDSDLDYGFYAIDADGNSLVCNDPVYECYEVTMDNGWYVNGKVCAYTLEVDYDSDFGYYATDFYYSEMDFATGAAISSKRLGIDDGYMQISTYNSNDGYIYGFGYDFMDNFGLVKAPATDPSNIELVKEIESDDICYTMTFNPLDGKIYGVTTSNKFISITPAGEYTEIAALDNELYETSFPCGMVYSAGEQKFYWNAQFTDFTTGLVTLSPEGEVEVVEEYYDAYQYTYLFTTDEAVSPDAPKTPVISATNFADGATSGTVTFILPSEMGNGDAIDSLEWFAMLDGAIHSRGTATGGTQLPVEFNDLATGFHTFGLYVEVGEARSNQATQTLYVGVDTPAAPADVTLTVTDVSWKPVTTGANGGYIDAANIKYEVYLNGELVTTTGETSAQVDIMSNEFAVYQASVIAVCGDNRSEAGVSNKLVDGKAMNLPVFFTPTPVQYELMAQLDANGDGRGWSYSNYYECLVTTFSKNGKPMDDWIFLPAINLDSADKFYTFGMNSRKMGVDFNNEFVEVMAFYGKPDPTAPSVTVLEKFQVGDETENIGHFQAETPGTWYIGIHCVSDPDQYGIIVKDIFVRDENIVAESPAAVTGLTATAHENGVLKATVAFTFPTKTFKGEDLPADAELVATVKAESTVTVTGKPGAPASAVVETHQGDNVIAVSVSLGENGAPETTCAVYTGVVAPERIMAMSMDVAPDMMSAELYWNAPTEGVNGGYIDPELVSYEVYREVATAFGTAWAKLADCGTSKSYTFVMPEGAPMETVTLGVLAINAAGNCGTITYRENLLGTPYTLPIVETFEEPEELAYTPWLIYYGDEGVSYGWGELQLISPEVFPSNTKSALYGRSRAAGTRGAIGVPRFSTKNLTAVELTIDSYTGEYAAETTVTAEYHGLETPVVLENLPVKKDEFGTTVIELPAELLNKEWVQIYLESDFTETSSVMAATKVEIQDKTAGIIDITPASAAIRGEKGGIRLLGHDGERVTVTTVEGKTMNVATCGSDTFLPAGAGLYIVHTPAATAKVVVR